MTPVQIVALWNAALSAGDEVDYHPVIGEATCRRRELRTKAYVAPSGHPAVFLWGESGYVVLDACTLVDDAEKGAK